MKFHHELQTECVVVKRTHNNNKIFDSNDEQKENKNLHYISGRIHYPYMKSLFADEIHAERECERVAKLKQTRDMAQDGKWMCKTAGDTASIRQGVQSTKIDCLKRFDKQSQVNANYCQFHWG